MAVRRSRLVLLSVRGRDVDPPRLSTGVPAEVQGRFFAEGCDDTGSSSVLGCSAPEPGSEEVPITAIRLTLVQGEKKWDLGTADAGTGGSSDPGHVSWVVRVPHEVRSGPAVLVAGGARLRVEIDGRRHLDR